MNDLFIFGTLLDGDLRRVVAGCDLAGHPAVLNGQGVWRASRGDYPVLGAGDGAAGLLLCDVPSEALARLHFYEEGFGYVTDSVTVCVDGAMRPATVYVPANPAAPSGDEWSLADWQAGWGAMTRRAAQEAMALFGTTTGEGLRQRMGTIRVRAASSLRAETREVAGEPFGRSAVTTIAARRPYVNFFAVEEQELSHRRFDGTQSGVMTRAGFLMGDAVTVLPYDPVRDRVLLVEQFRYGIYLRGDPAPWSLEPVAGRIDPGEDPETAVRREAQEEAGLEMGRLHHVANHYPSPAAVTEFLFSYVGLCDLPGLTPGAGGLDSEHEDIRTHVMAFDDLMARIGQGVITNTPLLLTAYWLLNERSRPGAFA
ncbi:NUDIX domain-containing protein [Oceaniglobus trochenteri]|uniref:NUDIX domain-containing protein n=1 Tax=Oceaniglobus trochenteri TaxID=2763260 RepID=UPI001CFF7C89|nr:NUDIX domain-containing protein [Oceaniglobus trochenteri]